MSRSQPYIRRVFGCPGIEHDFCPVSLSLSPSFLGCACVFVLVCLYMCVCVSGRRGCGCGCGWKQFLSLPAEGISAFLDGARRRSCMIEMALAFGFLPDHAPSLGHPA